MKNKWLKLFFIPVLLLAVSCSAEGNESKVQIGEVELSHPSGSIASGTEVVFSCNTPDVEFWYRLNLKLFATNYEQGTKSSSVILNEAAFEEGNNCILSVLATDGKGNFSPVKKGVYTLAKENTALYLGNPSGAVTDASFEKNYLMEKTTYALSYNNETHNPNWVSWHLCASDLGSLDRSDTFRRDAELPSGWYQVSDDDYTGSGLTRGHMVPSSHRTATFELNDEVFLMTNMVPQTKANNNTVWEGLEALEKTWASSGREMYIICGPYYDPSKPASYMTSTKTSTKDIRIPDSTWRVEIILDEGTCDISRITSESTVIAINVPNTESCYTAAQRKYDAKDSWKYYITTVDEIETMTGYDFFAGLPDDVERALESKAYSE